MPSPAPSSSIVILGAGIGGETVANQLSEQLNGKASITIVEKKSSFAFPPAFNWIVFGTRDPKEVQRTLAINKRKNVKVINREAEKIDRKKQLVKTATEELHYDKLVIALGADLMVNAVPGFDKYAHSFYDFDSAIKLRDKLDNFQGGKIGIGITGLPFKCPPAPYELALLLRDYCNRMKKTADIEIFTPENLPLPAAGLVIGRQVERLLGEYGIKYHPKMKLEKMDDKHAYFENGTEFSYDLFIGVPPHQPPKIVKDAGFVDESGWIPVNPYTLTTKYENVYALGDVVSIETPHGHAQFLPKAGVFAKGQANVLAHNLATAITGNGQPVQWDGTGECYLQVNRSECALLRGTFLANPPRLEFHPPRRKWFLAKENQEKRWMSKQF